MERRLWVRASAWGACVRDDAAHIETRVFVRRAARCGGPLTAPPCPPAAPQVVLLMTSVHPEKVVKANCSKMEQLLYGALAAAL